MKIKTSELTGAALDWVVGKLELVDFYFNEFDGICRYTLSDNLYSPSEEWAIGGPIIEREGIEINVRNWTPSPGCRLPGKYEWSARLCYVRQTDCKQFGPTPLIAAMRCYVDSKLGLEIDVPEELL